MTDENRNLEEYQSVASKPHPLRQVTAGKVVASLLWGISLGFMLTGLFVALLTADSLHKEIRMQTSLSYQQITPVSPRSTPETPQREMTDIEPYLKAGLILAFIIFCWIGTRTAGDVFIRLRWVFAIFAFIHGVVLKHAWSDLQNFSYVTPYAVDDDNILYGALLYVSLSAGAFLVLRHRIKNSQRREAMKFS